MAQSSVKYVTTIYSESKKGGVILCKYGTSIFF